MGEEMNLKEATFKPGIIGPEDQDLAEIGQIEPGKREVPKGRLAAGLALMLTGYLTTACGPIQAQEPTPIVTETTGIPPTPTLEITPTPTEIPPTPTPTKEPIPTPEPTVTVEVVGFGMEDLTPEEQTLVSRAETSYRTAAENQGLKEGIIYLTHGDQVGEIGGYFKDKKGFWYLVEREENKVLEEVPKFYDEPFWNPDEVRFEYPPSEDYIFIWKPKERIIWELTTNSAVAQWNPETSSWNMNPEPTPTPESENWTYIEGVEHVKFAEFNQEQLQMLKEAAALVKQYDPERFALFGKEIDWVILADEYCSPPNKINVPPGAFRGDRVLVKCAIAHSIWGHELQHEIQRIKGMTNGDEICPATGDPVMENDARIAQVDLLKKIREGIPGNYQRWVDETLDRLESDIDRSCLAKYD